MKGYCRLTQHVWQRKVHWDTVRGVSLERCHSLCKENESRPVSPENLLYADW